ncbi:hypothetical protein BDZ97DRAFT_1397932 [Flammula alnicola]|nr:hypothetical protein BDZ97DRAFT_1397932 [Flammula alnicola]
MPRHQTFLKNMLESRIEIEYRVHQIICGDDNIVDLASEIMATAARRSTYAERAVPVVEMLAADLREWDPELAKDFRHLISERSLSVFFDFWQGTFDDRPPLKRVHAKAVTTLVGGLISVKIIAYDRFKICALLLIENFQSLAHLSYVLLLFETATASDSFIKEPAFLLKCLAILQGRCRQVFRSSSVSQEETKLTQLIYNVLFGKQTALA